MVKEYKHLLRGCLGTLIGPWSLAPAFGHVHTLYIEYVHGGWSALTLSDGTFVGDKRG